MFLIGAGIAWGANYDLVSCVLIASYASLGATQLLNLLNKRKSRDKSPKNREIPRLEELTGKTFQDPETGVLSLVDRNTSRLLSMFDLLKSNSPALPPSTLDTVASQGIPLVYMNLGNQQSILAIERRGRGSKPKRRIWKKPELSKRELEFIKHQATMLESGLKTGGVECNPILGHLQLNWLLRIPSTFELVE